MYNPVSGSRGAGKPGSLPTPPRPVLWVLPPSWGRLANGLHTLAPTVGHHHPGHRALLPRIPAEGLPLRRDGDRGQELGWYPGPPVVLQVRLAGGTEPSQARRAALGFPPIATSWAMRPNGPNYSSGLVGGLGQVGLLLSLHLSICAMGQLP